MDDLETARSIVAKRDHWVGQHGALQNNIAAAVAEGIAFGRRDGLEIAAQLLADKLKAS
jgi:hypothetical protein